MSVVTLTINDQLVTARQDQTILNAAREAGIHIPTLCYVNGLSAHGGCRLCLVEVKGSSQLQPACFLKVVEGQEIQTHTERLQTYRRLIVEMLFAEGNHVCAICVARGKCELQQVAAEVGMDHVTLEYLYPERAVDITHPRFGIDHHRCILCTRCVRACDELEGAHTWDVAGRGIHTRMIVDMDQPWGTSQSCTSCGKCFMACPTGAIFPQGATVGSVDHQRGKLESLVEAREKKQWLV